MTFPGSLVQRVEKKLHHSRLIEWACEVSVSKFRCLVMDAGVSKQSRLVMVLYRMERF